MIPILNAKQSKEAEAATFVNEPIKPIDLMERAASEVYHKMTDFIKFFKKNNYYIFCGKGNNGGDGLALARLMAQDNYKVIVYIVNHTDKESTEFQINLERLKRIKKVPIKTINSKDDIELISDEVSGITFIIDAILGTGLKVPLGGLIREVVEYINNLSNAFIYSIDLPTGLKGEDNDEEFLNCFLKPNVVFNIGTPKLSMLLPETYERVELKWLFCDIGLDNDYLENNKFEYYLTETEDFHEIASQRPKFCHKNDFGHSYLIAGSKGMMGAAVLAAKACLRSGTGLLTVRTPKCGYTILQSAVPEALVDCDSNEDFFSGVVDLGRYDAVGVGCGIGKSPATVEAFKYLLQNVKVPIVIDADALNILSENPELRQLVPEKSILTPHPGEFKRLVGTYQNDKEKLSKLKTLAQELKSYIVLKEAYTVIAAPFENCYYFNQTGNPALATAGSGDVLTGMILGFLAQGHSPLLSALAGVYFHGAAADVMLKNKIHEKSVIASDLINFIPEAMYNATEEIFSFEKQ